MIPPQAMSELELGLVLMELRLTNVAEAFPGDMPPVARIVYPFERTPGHHHVVVEDSLGRTHELCAPLAEISRYVENPNEGLLANKIACKVAADYN